MNINNLIATGLSPAQAAAYALLVEKSDIKPAEAAKHLQITRTNAYKLLDKLVELGIAIKYENGKTLSYRPNNPLALTSITAAYRAEAVAREAAVGRVIQDLLEKYQQHADKPLVEVVTGQKAVAAIYRRQIDLNEDIYFIHTRSDIPAMGFDTMHDIRIEPAHRGLQRHGLLTAPMKTDKVDHQGHERSNMLDVGWLDSGEYTAPVEWSVTESSLLIVLYGNEPHAILIGDALVAGAFLQIWNLLRQLVGGRPLQTELSSR